MQATRHYRLRLAAAALTLMAGCDGAAPPPSPKAFGKAEAAARFSRIKELHDQSCLCRLAGRDSSAIDARLSTETTGLKAGGADAPAIPVRYLNDCYPELGRSACITTYSLHSSVGGGEVCTADQSQTLRDAYDSQSGASERTSLAVEKKFAEMREAAAKTIPQSACN